MAKIYYEIDVGYCGCGNEGVIEVGEATDEERNAIVQELANSWAEQWIGDERLMSAEEWEESEEYFWEGVGGFWEPFDESRHDMHTVESL